jgi:hypothetical protein
MVNISILRSRHRHIAGYVVSASVPPPEATMSIWADAASYLTRSLYAEFHLVCKRVKF